MRLNTRRGQRIATGAGVTAALTLAFAGVVSAPTSNAADPDQKSTFNSQAGSPAEFGGYVGYRGADGADGAAKAATHDKAKPADPTLGKPGGSTLPGCSGSLHSSNSADQDLGRYTKLGQASTTPDDVAAIRRAIAAKGTARVNVNTKVPVALESNLSASGVSAQHRAIRSSLNALDSSLAGTGAKLVSRLQVQPTATYQVNRAGLDALLAERRRRLGDPRRLGPAGARRLDRRHRLRPAQHGRRPRQQLRGQRRRLRGRDPRLRRRQPAQRLRRDRSSPRPASRPTPTAPAALTSPDRRQRGRRLHVTPVTALRPRHARRRHRGRRELHRRPRGRRPRRADRRHPGGLRQSGGTVGVRSSATSTSRCSTSSTCATRATASCPST